MSKGGRGMVYKKDAKQGLTEERVREIVREEIAERLAKDAKFAMRIMRHFSPSQPKTASYLEGQTPSGGHRLAERVGREA